MDKKLYIPNRINIPYWTKLYYYDKENEYTRTLILYNYCYKILFGLFSFNEIVQRIDNLKINKRFYIKLYNIVIFNKSFHLVTICNQEEAHNNFTIEKVFTKYSIIFFFMDIRDYFIRKFKK